jgi:hypothetical protein
MRGTPGGFEKWQETSRQRGHFSCIDEAVLTTRTILKDRATAARLRRGFGAEEQPRRVEVDRAERNKEELNLRDVADRQ